MIGKEEVVYILYVINMKFGHFDDSKREYVITNPRTPYPWINYLGCEDFFSIITNTAGGSPGYIARIEYEIAIGK